MTYDRWRGTPRATAQVLDAAVTAARLAARVAFDDALPQLAKYDRDRVGVLLGAVTRDLLERAFPDGLDSDDVEQLLRECETAAAPWWPDVDGDDLVRALTGALGVGVEEETPADAAKVLVHGLLLVAQLLTRCDEALEPLLDDALGELMREQTIELP